MANKWDSYDFFPGTVVSSDFLNDVVSKNKETISALDFGIDNTGTTSCVTALNLALSTNPGKTLHLSAGKYLIDGTVTIPHGTALIGEGGCDIFNPGTSGVTFYITHTSAPAFKLQRGAKIERCAFWYPNQVTTSPPTAYDFTLAIDFSDTTVFGGNNAGVTIKDIVIHNAYKGIDLGGEIDASPVYGQVMMNNIRMYALYTGVRSVATYSEVNCTDLIHSPGMWTASIGTAVRTWAYTDGNAIWHYEGTQGTQFSNCTFFGHRRGLLLSNPSATPSTNGNVTFLKATGCLFDGCRVPIEVTDKLGLGQANFSGCQINAGQFNDTAYNDCVGFLLNGSEGANFVKFSGCSFGASAGSHVRIANTNASFYRVQFDGCDFINANRNNNASTYYNIDVNDARATVQIDGCLFDNTNDSTVTNIKVTNARTLMINGIVGRDDASKLFEIGTISARLSIKGVTSEATVSNSTFPSSSNIAVASATTLTLPDTDSDFITVTGTTGITSITASWPERVVNLKFNGALTVTDGSNLKLNGNFTTSADDILTLVCDGTNWYERGRSAN